MMDAVAPEPALSYDITTSYDNLPPPPELPSLASRIGNTKVYLREEQQKKPTLGKRKLSERLDDDDEAQQDEDGDVEMDTEGQRQNAIYIRGPPISHLSTDRIFAYAAHYNTKPMALEWLDDKSCILVFPSKAAARSGFENLKKPDSGAEASSELELTLAHSLPKTLWPPSDRIASTLGVDTSDTAEDAKTAGLKGPLEFRWATSFDVKPRNAKSQSEYYRKHGRPGQPKPRRPTPPLVSEEDTRLGKRLKRDDGFDHERQKEALDNELDNMWAEPAREDSEDNAPEEDEEAFIPSKMHSDRMATSKMRSDVITARGGRTQADTSFGRSSLGDRITAPLPRRRGRRGRKVLENILGDAESGSSAAGKGLRAWDDDELIPEADESNGRESRNGRRGGGRRGGRGAGGRTERPSKTQQELDDELDAFLRT